MLRKLARFDTVALRKSAGKTEHKIDSVRLRSGDARHRPVRELPKGVDPSASDASELRRSTERTLPGARQLLHSS